MAEQTTPSESLVTQGDDNSNNNVGDTDAAADESQPSQSGRRSGLASTVGMVCVSVLVVPVLVLVYTLLIVDFALRIVVYSVVWVGCGCWLCPNGWPSPFALLCPGPGPHRDGDEEDERSSTASARTAAGLAPANVVVIVRDGQATTGNISSLHPLALGSASGLWSIRLAQAADEDEDYIAFTDEEADTLLQTVLDADFTCPISRDLFHDPVIAADGHTYERREIRRWMQERNSSPLTNSPLESPNLVKDEEKRKRIVEALEQIRGSDESFGPFGLARED
mmetsp:Transcript_8719/g.32165  ORF Transcript_8719/g.32165 Transcript_8719/m.32165 type:complete len:280 (-) Transcript_8719:462-1301(-)